MSRLVFWQNAVSIHQAPLMRALARQWPGEVHVVTDEGLSNARRAAGWTMPDYGGARLHAGPHTFSRREIVETFGGPGSVHVFSSLSAYRGVRSALHPLAGEPETLIGVFAEAGSTMGGLKARLRPLRHRLDALRWRDRIHFFLAVGEKGVSYYTRSGHRHARLYPFGYAVAGAASDDGPEPPSRRVLFVGQLIHLKGVDVLLEAFAETLARRPQWRLDIAGDGPEREALQRRALGLGLGNRVAWHGSLANDEVRLLMREAAMLVLPSHYDGWGAVVNEALGAGTPVAVSDACGAADLVSGARGAVFAAGSVAALGQALAGLAARSEAGTLDRRAIAGWAARAISPEAMARYLIEIVAHARGTGPRPEAPWSEA